MRWLETRRRGEESFVGEGVGGCERRDRGHRGIERAQRLSRRESGWLWGKEIEDVSSVLRVSCRFYE